MHKSVEDANVEDKAPTKKGTSSLVQYDEDDEELDDVDGKPLDSISPKNNSDDEDGVPLNEDLSKPAGIKIGFNPLGPDSNSSKPSLDASSLFIKSKWETLDEEKIEIDTSTSSTNKFELFSKSNNNTPKCNNEKRNASFKKSFSLDKSQADDIDGEPLANSGFGFNLVAYDDDDVSSDDNTGSVHAKTNDRPESKIGREKLREIELRVMRYQDELESANRQNKSSHISQESVNEQVKKYRDRLIESVTNEKLMGRRSPSNSDRKKYGRNSSSDRKNKRKNKMDSDDSSSDDNRKRKRDVSSSSRNGSSSRVKNRKR